MRIQINKLAMAIGVTFAVAASSSHALLISSSVDSSVAITLNGATNKVTDSSTSAVNSALDTHPDHYYVGAGKATGDASGLSAVNAIGTWYAQVEQHYALPFTYAITSNLTHTAVITNNESFAQNIDFSFLINAGEIDHGSSSIYNSSSDYVRSGYIADISVNGSSLWQSAGESQAHLGGFNLALSGASLNGTVGDDTWLNGPAGTYKWGDYASSTSIGFLNPGQSLTLTYSLTAYVNEHFEQEGYAYTPKASIGDPFGFNGTPVFAASNFITSPADNNSTKVPEPANTLLLGAGLAALAFRRRKARKTAV